MKIRLVVSGEPKGQGRHRTTRTGHSYTPAETVTAQQRIQGEWIDAGRPRFGEEPLLLTVECVLSRPKNHWLQSGGLSTAGVRSVWPTKKPDADNAVKLIMDALNGMAYRDDVLVCGLRFWRRWANADEPAHTVIEIQSLSV